MGRVGTTGPGKTWGRLGAGLAALLVLAWCTAAGAQEQDALRLRSLSPGGARSHLTESWGSLRFALSNRSAEDRQARVLTFYAGAPDRQYGRDAWVPAKSTLWTWSTLGPPAAPLTRTVAELNSLLIDRTGGQEHLIRSQQGQPLHADLLRYRRREASTTLMLDADIADGTQGEVPAPEEARAGEARDLVRVFRHRRTLSQHVSPVRTRFLPPVPEAFDGVDQFVLASNRLTDDPAGQQALRTWLQRGGTLWVMLDRVEPATVATLLGDVLDFDVVDRVSLTHLDIRNGPANPYRAETPARDVEEPVDFVRVLVAGLPVLYTVDGWPAAFRTEVGRGRVFFTTLGPRGWTRPRTPDDPKSNYEDFPELPVGLLPFDFLSDEIQASPGRPPFTADDLRTFVTEQVGYAVIGRKTILLVFGSFFLVLAVVAIVLARRGLLEHLGWLGPALALGAAAGFVGLGELSRGAVPPTVSVAQVVDAVTGVNEVQTSGFLAVYQPSPTTAPVGAEEGGDFELDFSGLEGRVLRRVQTDLDRWHWENLELPAGVRTGPFRHTVRTAEPVEATVRFGPEGLEGRVAAGPFEPLEDTILSTPGQHAVAINVGEDGGFRAGSADELPPGQWLAGGLLSDRQRAHQALYARLLADPPPRYLADRSLLLGWAEPVPLYFTLTPGARTLGSALVAIPLRFERTPPGTQVSLPAAFVACQRLSGDGRPIPLATESRLATNQRLRFQIPPAVLPLTVERARLTVKVVAPGREVVLTAVTGGEEVTLRRLVGPFGSEQVEMDDPRLLRPDQHGVLTVGLNVGAVRGGLVAQDLWRLEAASLEVQGRTSTEGGGEHESR